MQDSHIEKLHDTLVNREDAGKTTFREIPAPGELREYIKEKKYVNVKIVNPKYQIYTLQLENCQIVDKKVDLICEN